MANNIAITLNVNAQNGAFTNNFPATASRTQDTLGFEFNRIYIPVVVTTAELVASYFDPVSITTCPFGKGE